MRTFLIAALLAGVAAPAFAARPHADGDRPHERSDRSDRSESKDSAPKQERSTERPQRSAEPRNQDSGGSGTGNGRNLDAPTRTIDAGHVQAVGQVHRRDVGDNQDGPRHQAVETAGEKPHRNFEPKEVRAPRNVHEVAPENASGDSVRNWRSRERHNDGSPTTIEERNVRRAPAHVNGGELVQPKHPGPRVVEQGQRRISRTPIRGTEPPIPRTAGTRQAHAARHWNNNWRHDNRYDWRKWRKHHHSHFHLGFYTDPFGWDYFRYGVGWRLWPSYYRNSFWLNDPCQYRLPPAYGPYRWVRYYNDALLVNIYTGQVADVIYGFFW